MIQTVWHYHKYITYPLFQKLNWSFTMIIKICKVSKPKRLLYGCTSKSNWKVLCMGNILQKTLIKHFLYPVSTHSRQSLLISIVSQHCLLISLKQHRMSQADFFHNTNWIFGNIFCYCSVVYWHVQKELLLMEKWTVSTVGNWKRMQTRSHYLNCKPTN